MRTRIVAGVTPAVLLATLGTCLAQQDVIRPREARPAQPAERQPGMQQPGEMRAQARQGQQHFFVQGKNIAGAKVVNKQQEDIGKLDDLLVDARSGYAVYAILSHGGFLGIGDKLIAVPWRALEVLPDSNGDATIVLDATKQTLEQAPNFDKDQWPLIGERGWMARTHDFFKTEPSTRAGATGGWGRDSAINRVWDQGRDQTIRGQITRVDHRSPGRGISEATVIVVKADDGKEHQVTLGPDWFIQGQHAPLRENQAVTIEARELRLGNDTLIVAREVSMPDGARLVLRDRTGAPIWDTSAPDDAAPPAGGVRTAATGDRYIRGSELKGKNIQGAGDEKLADLKELAIDPGTGKVAFVVLSAGGLAGMGGRDVVVPWEACTFIKDGEKIALRADEATLRSAPELGEGGFAMVNQPEFRQKVLAFYSTPQGRMFASPEPRQRQPVMHEGDGEGWVTGSEYNKHFKGESVTLTGTVQESAVAAPMPGMSDGIRVTIDSPEGPRIVHIGPSWFVSRQGLRFHKGDQVTIKGARANIGGEDVILAQQVTTADGTVRLRDEQGRPNWDALHREMNRDGREMEKDLEKDLTNKDPAKDPGRGGGR
ncbi:MAG: PRC-barrel domain-containing protein [Phycisphaerales bacterium]